MNGISFRSISILLVALLTGAEPARDLACCFESSRSLSPATDCLTPFEIQALSPILASGSRARPVNQARCMVVGLLLAGTGFASWVAVTHSPSALMAGFSTILHGLLDRVLVQWDAFDSLPWLIKVSMLSAIPLMVFRKRDRGQSQSDSSRPAWLKNWLARKPVSYYEILGIPPEARLADILLSRRRLAQKWHPDLNPGDRYAEEILKAVHEAYDTLRDAGKRAAYDFKLLSGAAKAESSGRRSWQATSDSILSKANPMNDLPRWFPGVPFGSSALGRRTIIHMSWGPRGTLYFAGWWRSAPRDRSYFETWRFNPFTAPPIKEQNSGMHYDWQPGITMGGYDGIVKILHHPVDERIALVARVDGHTWQDVPRWVVIVCRWQDLMQNGTATAGGTLFLDDMFKRNEVYEKREGIIPPLPGTIACLLSRENSSAPWQGMIWGQDGRSIRLHDRDGTITTWNPETGISDVRWLKLPQVTPPNLSSAQIDYYPGILPDPRGVFAAYTYGRGRWDSKKNEWSDPFVDIWHTASQRRLVRLPLAKDHDLKWDHQGNLYFTRGLELFRWNAGDLRTVKSVCSLPDVGLPQRIAISPDGRLLAVGSSKLMVIDLATGQRVNAQPIQSYTLAHHLRPADPTEIYISSLDWSSEGSFLATEGRGTLTLWQAEANNKKALSAPQAMIPRGNPSKKPNRRRVPLDRAA